MVLRRTGGKIEAARIAQCFRLSMGHPVDCSRMEMPAIRWIYACDTLDFGFWGSTKSDQNEMKVQTIMRGKLDKIEAGLIDITQK